MDAFGLDGTTGPGPRPNALDGTDAESFDDMMNEISGRSEPPWPVWQPGSPSPCFYAQALLPQSQETPLTCNPSDSVSWNGNSRASEPQSNLINTEEFGRSCSETWDLAAFNAFEQSAANLNDPCSSPPTWFSTLVAQDQSAIPPYNASGLPPSNCTQGQSIALDTTAKSAQFESHDYLTISGQGEWPSNGSLLNFCNPTLEQTRTMNPLTTSAQDSQCDQSTIAEVVHSAYNSSHQILFDQPPAFGDHLNQSLALGDNASNHASLQRASLVGHFPDNLESQTEATGQFSDLVFFPDSLGKQGNIIPGTELLVVPSLGLSQLTGPSASIEFGWLYGGTMNTANAENVATNQAVATNTPHPDGTRASGASDLSMFSKLSKLRRWYTNIPNSRRPDEFSQRFYSFLECASAPSPTRSYSCNNGPHNLPL
jgi:hypothetical protein